MNNKCIFCEENFEEGDILINSINFTAISGAYKNKSYVKRSGTSHFKFIGREDSYCHLPCLKEKLHPLKYQDLSTPNTTSVRRFNSYGGS